MVTVAGQGGRVHGFVGVDMLHDTATVTVLTAQTGRGAKVIVGNGGRDCAQVEQQRERNEQQQQQHLVRDALLKRMRSIFSSASDLK